MKNLVKTDAVSYLFCMRFVVQNAIFIWEDAASVKRCPKGVGDKKAEQPCVVALLFPLLLTDVEVRAACKPHSISAFYKASHKALLILLGKDLGRKPALPGFLRPFLLGLRPFR